MVALALLLAACTRDHGVRPADTAGSGASALAALPPNGVHYVIGKPYQFDGVWYRPAADEAYDAIGAAVVYGPDAAGQRTVDGETYDPRALTAAHKTLPLPSIALVENLANGQEVRVRINDRGPFRDDQLVQLSAAAAGQLGIKPGSPARVRLRILAAASRALAEDLARGGTPAVTPAPAPKAMAVAPGFYIQAGAFRDASNAARLRDNLAAFGPAKIVVIERNGERLNGVRLGPIATRAAAERLLKQVIELGQKGAWLVAVNAS
jgi:rare lipoprotein A